MKRIIPVVACLLAAQQTAAQVLPDGDLPTISGPTTLRHMSAAAGESRSFVVDVPAGANLFELITEGGSGLPGVQAVSLGSGLPCQMEPSRDRGPVCLAGWSDSAPRKYAVTLSAGPDEGYDDVTVRIAHGARPARSGMAYSDVDASVAGGTGRGFVLDLRQPGPLSVGTWGGGGDLQLRVVHHDGSWGGRIVCDLNTPGTWHACQLPQAAPGRYRIDLLGSFRDTNLRADWD